MLRRFVGATFFSSAAVVSSFVRRPLPTTFTFRFDSSTPSDVTHNQLTALDVAMKVNKLKRLHQTGQGQGSKKSLEITAWQELNTLTEQQIGSAEGKAVALLLNSWAYFSKFWEKGKDGPGTSGEDNNSPSG